MQSSGQILKMQTMVSLSKRGVTLLIALQNFGHWHMFLLLCVSMSSDLFLAKYSKAEVQIAQFV